MADSPHYPRVLIVGGTPVSSNDATGLTLLRLFSDWPRDRLAEMTAFAPPEKVDAYMCDRQHMLAPGAAPVDHLIRNVMGMGRARVFTGAPVHPMVPMSAAQRRSWRSSVHMSARAAADASPLLLSREARAWIRDFRPEVVYSTLGRIRLLRLAVAAARAADCPIVPHFMDDWPGIMYTDGQLWGLARRLLARHLKAVFARAHGGMCIGDAMAAEYAGRFGKPFRPFMNCVDEAWFRIAPGAGVTPAGEPLRLMYSGGLHVGRDSLLLRLARVVEELNRRGSPVRLLAFTPRDWRQRCSAMFAGFAHVSSDSLEPHEVVEQASRADVLVHIESFDPANAVFTRWSVSTKIPEYLASGKPILAIGPDGLASMRHLAESGAAVAVSSQDDVALGAAIGRLLDREFRGSLGLRGRAFARDRHAASAVREAFRATLCEFSLARQ